MEIKTLAHLFVTVFFFHFSTYIVSPVITDVMMEALCPGRDQCSLVIYLSGIQQAMTGLGTMILTPLVGNLSDKYGRKALLTIPMTVAIIPPAILAYNRSRPYFYAFYGIKMFTGMLCDGSVQCLSFAYVANKVEEGHRASAFGILSGVTAAGFVSATLTSRVLPASYIFQASAAVALIAAVYMRLFLVETNVRDVVVDECSQPLCSDSSSTSSKLCSVKKAPSVLDMIFLLKNSLTLLRAALITFFVSLGEGGLQASLLYFLKAKFQFSKDQFANLFLILGVAGASTQLFLMPALTRVVGEEILLSGGLLASFAYAFLYSIAWASWVPYFSSAVSVLSVFVHPCIRSAVSKKVGPREQGVAQGCMTGVTSFGSIIAPLAFTPLTALFLSETAPFDFKGFSLLICGFASLVAFALSITMRETQPVSSKTETGV